MAKLNQRAVAPTVARTAAAQLLQRLLFETQKSYTPHSGVDDGGTADFDEARLFYENYYVPFDSDGTVPVGIDMEGRTISDAEARLLQYAVGEEESHKPFVLLGHAGTGKSTLLGYVAKYLAVAVPDLRSRCRFLYVSLTAERTEVDAISRRAELVDFYENHLTAFAASLFHHWATPNVVPSFLTWLTNYSAVAAFRGRFGPSRRAALNTADALQDFVADLDTNVRQSWYREFARYYSTHIARITLVIDNVDRFDSEYHTASLSYGDQLANDGFGCILALRYSSYKKLDAQISEADDHVYEVDFAFGFSKQILLKRADVSHHVTLDALTNATATEKDLVTALYLLLRHPTTIDTIAALSNQNLHQVFRKLRGMTMSAYFDDKFLADALTHPERVRAPLYAMYAMLLSNYNGTFVADELASANGIINVFCNNSDGKHNAFAYFTRMQFLLRLFPASADEFIPIADIMADWNSVFEDELHRNRVARRSWFRLIHGGLVLTRSCRRYETLSDVDRALVDDAVVLSPCGDFYVRNLIGTVEYLYFMKDDIDWRSEPPFELAAPRRMQHSRIRDAIRTLTLLIRLEQQMLANIEDTCQRRNTAEPIRLYTELFSAQRAPWSKAGILVCEYVWQSYAAYLKELGLPHETWSEVSELKSLIVEANEIADKFRVPA